MAPSMKRLGMLVPSSNTVVEAETAKLLPADGSVSVHVSRLRVVQISDDDASMNQFEMERVLAAVDLLADARVDALLWNGTAAGWLGFERDDDLVRAIERHTGIRATTAIIAINAELRRLGARRIGLVTPYIAPLEAMIIANYGRAGIAVASAVRSNLTENTAYAAITPADIAAMVRTVAKTPVDAILILCTNLAGASIASGLERELGIPVLDSVKVAVNDGLAMLSA